VASHPQCYATDVHCVTRRAGSDHERQRLHRSEDYLAALGARGEDPLAYESYLQAFRSGMPPHGGFAIGLERWVSRLTGAANVRETTLFPRDRSRLTP
jgi:nondiscriminating aspartyl-tRNA synthetase